MMIISVFYGFLVDKNPQRITKKEREFVNNLKYEGLIFLYQKKIILKLNCNVKLVLICFAMRIKQLILFIYQIKMIAWIYC